MKNREGRTRLDGLQGAARAVASLWFATVFSSAAALGSQILAARYLGPEAYGVLASAVAATGIALSVVGFGVGQYWLQLFAEEGWRGLRWFSPSVRAVGVTGLSGAALLASWALLPSVSGEVRTATLLILPAVVVQGYYELAQASLQLEERYKALAGWLTLPQLLRASTVVGVVALGLGVDAIALGYGLFGAALGLGGRLFISRMRKGGFHLVGHGPTTDRSVQELESSPSWRDVLAASWPFGAAALFYMAYYQSDIVLVGWMRGSTEAGMYAVVFVVLGAAYLFPSTVYQRYLMPKLHRWAEKDRKKLYEVYRFGNGVMTSSGLLVGIIVFASAPYLIPLVFGQDYAPAIGALRIVALAAPVRYMGTSVGGVLSTGGNIRRKIVCQGSVAVVNIVLNLIAIPLLSYYGAAMTTVFSEALLLVLYLLVVSRKAFPDANVLVWSVRYAEADS